jgi:hypothetical protein
MNNIDILEEFKELVEESRQEDNYEYYIKLRNTLDLLEKIITENKELDKFIKEGITIEPNSPYENFQLNYLRENFIQKSKVKELLKEIENRNYNDYTGCQNGNEVKYNILLELQSLLGKE